MGKRLNFLLLLVLIGIFAGCSSHGINGPTSPLSCTSFAVFSGRPIYGMNFDYPDVPLRFTILSYGELDVFQMEFQDQGGYVPTVGMNSAGLFGSCQMLFPEMPESSPGGRDPLAIWQLFQYGLSQHQEVAGVLDLVEQHQVTNSGLTLHDLFADPSGAAVVVEVINDRETLTAISGQYLVMTNFPVSSVDGLAPGEIEGVGADRYQKATRFIESNLQSFQVDQALQALQDTALSGEFSTQASMVFDPLSQEIHIALDRDFDRIWRVSLSDHTIESFEGFAQNEILPLDHRGITEPEMLEMGLPRSPDDSPFPDLLLPFGLPAILVLIVWAFRRRYRKTSQDPEKKL